MPTSSRSGSGTPSSSASRSSRVYSFSTENWTRPREEVEGLMAMFAERIDRETPELDEEGVRMRFIGRREGVSEELTRPHGLGRGRDRGRTTGSPCSSPSTTAAGPRSSTPPRLTGGRGGGVPAHLYAPEMHDPDLLIRTSGEQRISNYLLWQCAYSEFVFRDELWPDFGREAFEDSLRNYEERQRRFGARGDRRPRPALVRVRARAAGARPAAGVRASCRIPTTCSDFDEPDEEIRAEPPPPERSRLQRWCRRCPRPPPAWSSRSPGSSSRS